jgi:hypothetical protein
MNLRPLLALVCLFAVPPATALRATLASDPLIATLQIELGVTRAQATSGIGALLTLAQQRLVPEEFSIVANALPDGAYYLQRARAQRIVIAPLDADGFVEILQKRLGISSEAAVRFAPSVIVFVARQVGREDAGELLVIALGL